MENKTNKVEREVEFDECPIVDLKLQPIENETEQNN